jgi:hypothetical protein
MDTKAHESFWSAVAERSGDAAFVLRPPASESGVALRFPPQSKTGGRGHASIRVHSCPFVVEN